MQLTESVVIRLGAHFRADLLFPNLFSHPVDRQKKLYRLAVQDPRNQQAVGDIAKALSRYVDTCRLQHIAATLPGEKKQAKTRYERAKKLEIYFTEQREKYHI